MMSGISPRGALSWAEMAIGYAALRNIGVPLVLGVYLGLHVMLVPVYDPLGSGAIAPGLYWRVAVRSAPPLGALVTFLPPDAFYSPRAPLKRGQVVAVAGETVCWDGDTMRLPAHQRSYARAFVGLGIPTPALPDGLAGCRVLHEHEVVVVGDGLWQLDSRHVGPLGVGRVTEVLTPLLTW
jgi:type IV secretory pathway protease TraF